MLALDRYANSFEDNTADTLDDFFEEINDKNTLSDAEIDSLFGDDDDAEHPGEAPTIVKASDKNKEKAENVKTTKNQKVVKKKVAGKTVKKTVKLPTQKQCLYVSRLCEGILGYGCGLNRGRGGLNPCGNLIGFGNIDDILKINNACYILRGHEWKYQDSSDEKDREYYSGFSEELDDKVGTLFSAANYGGIAVSNAAVLEFKLTTDEIVTDDATTTADDDLDDILEPTLKKSTLLSSLKRTVLVYPHPGLDPDKRNNREIFADTRNSELEKDFAAGCGWGRNAKSCCWRAEMRGADLPPIIPLDEGAGATTNENSVTTASATSETTFPIEIPEKTVIPKKADLSVVLKANFSQVFEKNNINAVNIYDFEKYLHAISPVSISPFQLLGVLVNWDVDLEPDYLYEIDAEYFEHEAPILKGMADAVEVPIGAELQKHVDKWANNIAECFTRSAEVGGCVEMSAKEHAIERSKGKVKKSDNSTNSNGRRRFSEITEKWGEVKQSIWKKRKEDLKRLEAAMGSRSGPTSFLVPKILACITNYIKERRKFYAGVPEHDQAVASVCERALVDIVVLFGENRAFSQAAAASTASIATRFSMSNNISDIDMTFALHSDIARTINAIGLNALVLYSP